MWYITHPHCTYLEVFSPHIDMGMCVCTYNYLSFFCRNRSLTLNCALFVLPCFISRPPLLLPSFFSLHFGSSSVLCYPSSALISLPTGTSGSIFGWWAAEGLKHRVSQRCVCVVEMFAQIDSDVVHPPSSPFFPTFSGVFLHVCVAPNTAAL